MIDAVSALFLKWIESRSNAAATIWLRERLVETTRTANEGSGRAFEAAYARVPRFMGRAALSLAPKDLAEAERVRPGWTPREWSVDDAARVLLLLNLSASLQCESFVEAFRRLRQAADPGEQIALFRGLALYPAPVALESETAEGLRTNIPSVFSAIAHWSPYPREVFDEHRWNHMVLKALFIGCPLVPIQGLDERANPRLATMLRDFARERRAASRPTPSELWLCLAPFAEEVGAAEDLEHALASDGTLERKICDRCV